MAQAFHQHGTDVLFIQRLLNIGDDIGPVQLRFGLWAGEHVAGRGDDLGVAALGR